MTDKVDFSKLTLSGGWCKHGLCEASYCVDCQKEWLEAGIDVKWKEHSIEEFKKAFEEIFNMEQQAPNE